jgi:UDP-2-acetamido-2-deoxy-ribo-hexuluronate aminotransferase
LLLLSGWLEFKPGGYVQFIDLHEQYQCIKHSIDNSIAKVISHKQFIMGPEVEQLEEQLANYVGVKHCIGVSSGSDALLIAMMALDIKPGDEVIIPAFSFFATAGMVTLLKAKPIIVDIDPNTYNIDTNLLAQAISPRTKANKDPRGKPHGIRRGKFKSSLLLY